MAESPTVQIPAPQPATFVTKVQGDVYVVARLDDAGKMEIQGVFSTRAAASAICKTERDAVVTFPLDVDCTEERAFEVEVPLAGSPPALITA